MNETSWTHGIKVCIAHIAVPLITAKLSKRNASSPQRTTSFSCREMSDCFLLLTWRIQAHSPMELAPSIRFYSSCLSSNANEMKNDPSTRRAWGFHKTNFRRLDNYPTCDRAPTMRGSQHKALSCLLVRPQRVHKLEPCSGT